VQATNWDAVRADLNDLGCALTAPLLSPDETAEISALYNDYPRFRFTVNMQ
jgi:hypothetical protein